MSGIEELKDQLLNKYVKIEISDQRKFYGAIKAIDYSGNIILSEVIVELPCNKLSPINSHIQYFLDFNDKKEMSAIKYFKELYIPEESNIFWQSRFYSLGYVVPFKVIENVSYI